MRFVVHTYMYVVVRTCSSHCSLWVTKDRQNGWPDAYSALARSTSRFKMRGRHCCNSVAIACSSAALSLILTILTTAFV
jgi:hypothetical protein